MPYEELSSLLRRGDFERSFVRRVQASFAINEEPHLTSSVVLRRVRRSFGADKLTKSFYREFCSFAGATNSEAADV